MSKERELLESMKASLNEGSSAAATATADAGNASGVSSGLDSALDFTLAFASSLASDPIFYVKVLGVLGLTVLIIMVSIELVSGG